MKKRTFIFSFIILLLFSFNCFSQVKNQKEICLKMFETLSRDIKLDDYKERFAKADDIRFRLVFENTGTPITELTVASKFVVASLSDIEKENLGFYMRVTSLSFSNDSSCIDFQLISKDNSQLKGNLTLKPNVPSSTYDLKNFKTNYKTSSSSSSSKSIIKGETDLSL